ncbi:MAG: tetratricopeptide repeat-containing sensor histidine kinase [Candidatus Kapaibacterium sp.]
MTSKAAEALLVEAEQQEISGHYQAAAAQSRQIAAAIATWDSSPGEFSCRVFLLLSKSLWRQGIHDEALTYGEEALTRVDVSTGDELRARIYSHLGNVYADLSNFPQAVDYYQQALTINQALGIKVETARNLGNMGLAYAEMLDYLNALKYYQQALAINEELGRTIGIAKNLGNIGLMYWNLQDYRHAIEYYTQSLALHQKIGSIAGIATTLGNLGNVYYNLLNYPTSLEYLQQSLAHFESIGDKHRVATNLGNIGNIYTDMGDYPSALEHLERARTISLELGNTSGAAIALGNIGGIYAIQTFRGYDPILAEKYLLEAIGLCEDIDNKRDQVEFYYYLSDLYATLHRWQEAYQCHTRYHELEKEVHNEEATKQTQRYAIERELAVMQREQEVLYVKNAELAAINAKLEESNKQLTQVNYEKNEFLGIAAHDLKNPLSVITMIATILQDESNTLTPEEIKSLADDIRTSSKHMFNLIVNVLDVNKIESGILLPAGEVLSVRQSIKIIAERFIPPAEHKSIALEWQADDLTIEANQSVVLQVLDNLVSNAVKFSPANTRITLSAHASGADAVRFSVEDQGPGLTDEDKQSLFGKFKRLSAKPTGGEHSTGLGLSIVKRLVEIMNGRIWVESEPGKGAIFIVELPVRQA